MRANNKRKNFKTKPPIEHEAGTIPDKTHPTKSGGLKKSKQKKLQEKNVRQSENSSARITLKKEILELTEEAANTALGDSNLFDDTNFSIGHSKLIDSPRWVARKAQEDKK